MMALGIGAAVGLGVCIFAWLAGLDRDRSFYPTVLIVIAAYYILFAAMGSLPAMAVEVAVFAGFLALAVAGLRMSLWIVVLGLLAHAMLDAVHHDMIENPGVPVWWPAFCAACDVAMAGCLALRLRFPLSISTRG